MKVKFYGTIKDGTYTRTHPEIFDAYCLGQPDGEYCDEFSKAVAPKTLAQLAYYYAVIIPTALSQMQEDGNGTKTIKVGSREKLLPLDKDDIDKILKDACATKDKGRMSMEEASEFIERCILWCATWLGCVIPPADKNWMR
jgi:hypothetical protein